MKKSNKNITPDKPKKAILVKANRNDSSTSSTSSTSSVSSSDEQSSIAIKQVAPINQDEGSPNPSLKVNDAIPSIIVTPSSVAPIKITRSSISPVPVSAKIKVNTKPQAPAQPPQPP
ncbi:MAG: hypothetical protein FD167_3134, partial [bacterium]